MSAVPRPPFPTYDDLYDACAKNGLRVKLHVATDPEGMNTREETYLPTVPVEDWVVGRSSERIQPLTTRHVPRDLTLFVEVRDGEDLCCSGDLGPKLGGELSVAPLRRMAGVLVAQGRVQPRHFPHLRP